MMIESEVILASNQWADVLNILLNQPDEMRPTQQSVDEDGDRVPINIERITDIGNFNGFLWSSLCGYEISLSHDVLKIFSFSDSSHGFRELMKEFCGLQIDFGYAAESQERMHRNKVIQKKPYGTHEAWVGRNYNKYLPGLYWITLIPLDMARKLGISLDELRGASTSLEIINNSNAMVVMYENPLDWKDNSILIESISNRFLGIFSKLEVEEKSKYVDDFFSVSEIFENYP